MAVLNRVCAHMAQTTEKQLARNNTRVFVLLCDEREREREKERGERGDDRARRA